ncbi:MAG: deoxyguanosinetriphosphate triphosphohydrolase [Clostridia bacterium]|nr:deoxyguanosinetriphosphate triphosphohydrolase [Clostridia bacterium]
MIEPKCLREVFYRRERESLSEFAFLTEKTKGRERYLEPCNIRTEFQRDRDRIIHCKSFRRLMHKTQVFLFPVDEHYRTRLSHTLEVTQIARIIARALLLNEDLCEAAALGHDLGHTPFGHAGESALRECFSPDFAHYKQSLRVVEKLERNGEGLNLTFEVRDGIVNHTGDSIASTLEGLIVKFADRIAYVNHDIDDALRAGIISPDSIPPHLKEILGNTQGERINTMVKSVVEASSGKNSISMTPEIEKASEELRTFLFENVYYNPKAKGEESKAKEMLIRLFEFFVKNPDKMPELNRSMIETEGVERCAADFISGMTDRYAIDLFKEIWIPGVWKTPAEI